MSSGSRSRRTLPTTMADTTPDRPPPSARRSPRLQTIERGRSTSEEQNGYDIDVQSSPSKQRPKRAPLSGGAGATTEEEPVDDRANIILLVVLYLLQGVPLGLAMGSMPFLLQKKLTYAQLATFSLASYPYSLKLLWSPIVDSMYWRAVGRRRSWIIPIQVVIGVFLYVLSASVDSMLEEDPVNISTLSIVFILLVMLSATQDIAVDGWALTLLSESNLSYASTCQTIGLNTGYFLSFTVFLALNSTSFCNTYLRSIPQDHDLLMLGPYLRFWAVCYFAVTFWLIFFKEEGKEKEVVKDMKSTYIDIWKIFQLPNVRTFTGILLLAKIGFIANDSVTGFKLMEKGFHEEDLALTVLINFPLQIVFGYYAARWSKKPQRLLPWSIAFYCRLVMAVVAMLVVAYVPEGGVTTSYFALVIVCSVLGAFFSTVQFVSMGAFFATIADPSIGGTYMTLLNTLSNFGGTYPQYFVLRAVDYFTVAQCHMKDGSTSDCSSKLLSKECKQAGGTCVIETDGFYWVSTATIIIGALVFWFFIMPNVKVLERLSPKMRHVLGSKRRPSNAVVGRP